MKPRNFNVKFAMLFGLIGAILYGAVVTGRVGTWFDNIDSSERPLSDQIIYIEPEHQETELFLQEAVGGAVVLVRDRYFGVIVEHFCVYFSDEKAAECQNCPSAGTGQRHQHG